MEFDVHYNEPVMRAVSRRFLARRLGWSGWVALVLSTLCTLWLVIAGPRDTSAGIVLGLLLAVLVVATVVYRLFTTRYLALTRKMKDPRTTFRIDPEFLTATNEFGSSQLRWDRLYALWKLPEAWLLFYAPSQFMTLPTADLTPEVREALLERLTAHGIPVQ